MMVDREYQRKITEKCADSILLNLRKMNDSYVEIVEAMRFFRETIYWHGVQYAMMNGSFTGIRIGMELTEALRKRDWEESRALVGGGVAKYVDVWEEKRREGMVTYSIRLRKTEVPEREEKQNLEYFNTMLEGGFSCRYVGRNFMTFSFEFSKEDKCEGR